MHRKIVLAGIVFLAFAGSYVGERALSQDHGFRRAKYGVRFSQGCLYFG